MTKPAIASPMTTAIVTNDAGANQSAEFKVKGAVFTRLLMANITHKANCDVLIVHTTGKGAGKS